MPGPDCLRVGKRVAAFVVGCASGIALAWVPANSKAAEWAVRSAHPTSVSAQPFFAMAATMPSIAAIVRMDHGLK